MGKPTLKVEGTQQVEAAFSEVSKGLRDMSKAHQAEGDMLIGDVRSLTRFDTGDLAAGWEPKGVADSAQFTNRVSYAGIQEFGWSAHNIEPTLAVERAFDANQSRTEQIYNDHIAQLARKANIETR